MTLKVNCDAEGIEKAFRAIEREETVVFPTDTVYGIGCDPYSEKAVEQIYDIKSRESVKKVPILTYSIETACRICHMNKFTKKIAAKFWPGPLTIILKVKDEKLKRTLGLEDKIAIRVPNHKCTLKLLQKCNFLVGTSANMSGHPPHTNPDECFKNFQNYDVFIDGGTIDSKSVSTIIEIENEKIKIIREGNLTMDEILEQ